MSAEKITELLNAIRTDPRARELLQGVSDPQNEEEMIRLCADIAPKLGFDVTEAELRASVAAAAQERRNRTAADMEKLSDDIVKNAAGGAEDAFGQGEKAPDGHEMGCFLIYYSYSWQKDHDTWCKKEFYCTKGHYRPDPCLDLSYCPGVIYK